MVLASFAKRDGPSHERGGLCPKKHGPEKVSVELPIKLHGEAASGDAKGTTGNLSAAEFIFAPTRRWRLGRRWSLRLHCAGCDGRAGNVVISARSGGAH